MPSDFHQLQQVWNTLGAEDPLWAVASLPEKRGGRWDLSEFLATGQAEVQRLYSLLQRQPQAPSSFRHILDFGCGVGRLTLAWKSHADAVTGVDISAPMLDKARRLAKNQPSIRYLHNPHPDLSQIPSNTFDLCFSHICLQHMPWPIARGYLREFARLCSPDGWIVFQLPSRSLVSGTAAAWRQRLVNALPFGLDRTYRRWRHGAAAVFDMHFTPHETVAQTLLDDGINLLHREPDTSAGPGTEGFIYLGRKPALA